MRFLFLPVWKAVRGCLSSLTQSGSVCVCEPGLQPDIVTLNTALAVIANSASRVPMARIQAESILQELLQTGLQPDVVTFNTLISASFSALQSRAVLMLSKSSCCVRWFPVCYR